MGRTILLVLLFTSIAGSATAEEPADGRESAAAGATDPTGPAELTSENLAARAERAFANGDYELAIEFLQKAYDLDNNPNMLYNIARVQEDSGDIAAALKSYREFVISADVDLDYRREALESSEAIERELAARKAPAPRPVDQRQPPTDEPGPDGSVMLRPAMFPTTSAMRPVGVTLAVVGGVALLTGAGLGVAALGRQSDFRNAQTLDERRAAGASARDLATAADALYISGAVLVVTGIVTAFASPRRIERQQGSSFDVTLNSNGVGAAWSLRF